MIELPKWLAILLAILSIPGLLLLIVWPVSAAIGFWPKRSPWIYGKTPSGSLARKHRRSGRVEFELWPAGHERGYPDRVFWHELGVGHPFVPDDVQPWDGRGVPPPPRPWGPPPGRPKP